VKILYLAGDALGEKAYYLLTAVVKEYEGLTQLLLRANSDKNYGLNGFLNEILDNLRHLIISASAREIGIIRKEQVINIIDSVVQRTNIGGGEGGASINIEGGVVQRVSIKGDEEKKKLGERLSKEREERELKQREEEEAQRERKESQRKAQEREERELRQREEEEAQRERKEIQRKAQEREERARKTNKESIRKAQQEAEQIKIEQQRANQEKSLLRRQRAEQEQKERENEEKIREEGTRNSKNKFFSIAIVICLLVLGYWGLVPSESVVVKKGNNISVDYIGSFQDGKVFDTSIQSVAQANELPPRTIYEPLTFKVGQKPSKVIVGLDKGVIGMKIGETKILTIPPEEAYPINPDMIRASPIRIVLPSTQTMPKVFEIPKQTFEQYFGMNHSAGDIVQIPDTNMKVTIINLSSQVSLSYNLKNGSNTWDASTPWNQTVIKVDDKNITLKPDVKKNDIFDIPNSPLKITIVDINATNITIKYNPTPETTVDIPGGSGQMVPTKISFNETSMIMDTNPEVAGKTLIFKVTLVSIDR
jgi:FKBP-type peptidyl-prolyl cis-trans isomerase 2